MKKIIFLACTTLIFTANTFVSAQEFDVPTYYKFENIEDYGFYRDDVILAINWLETTPLNEEKEKREIINQFLLQWLLGSPNISINIHPYVMELSQENPDLLMVFMGGWAKHQIQYEEQNNLKLNLLGIHSILKLYKLGGVIKDSNLEDLILMEENGDLEQWVQEKI